MKMFWKTEDRAIDSLLRARCGAGPAVGDGCQHFDADVANAYIEHCLTTAERERYEHHMADCPSCRTSTVALFRLAAADGAAPRPSAAPSAVGWADSLKGFFAQLATPQVALAAVAAVALAVSIPLALSRKGEQSSPMADQAQSSSQEVAKSSPPASAISDNTQRPASNAVAPGQIGGAGSGARTQSGEAAKPNEQKLSEVATAKATADQPAAPAGSAAAPPDSQSKDKDEAKAEQTRASEPERRQTSPSPDAQAGPPPASQPSTEQQKPLQRIDPDRALTTRKQDKDPVDMQVIKQGRADGERTERDREGTIRSEVATPPESSQSDNPARARIADGRRSNALLDKKEAESARKKENESARDARTPERRAGSKKFYLLKDVWTDKDFKPEKEMPVVTVTRDSDQYKELIAKYPTTLRVYFIRFSENERAIVVYKDTVYKLVPQGADK
jgi:putative zinc finger protein